MIGPSIIQNPRTILCKFVLIQKYPENLNFNHFFTSVILFLTGSHRADFISFVEIACADTEKRILVHIHIGFGRDKKGNVLSIKPPQENTVCKSTVNVKGSDLGMFAKIVNRLLDYFPGKIYIMNLKCSKPTERAKWQRVVTNLLSPPVEG